MGCILPLDPVIDFTVYYDTDRQDTSTGGCHTVVSQPRTLLFFDWRFKGKKAGSNRSRQTTDERRSPVPCTCSYFEHPRGNGGSRLSKRDVEKRDLAGHVKKLPRIRT
jgi:hypothetical protein